MNKEQQIMTMNCQCVVYFSNDVQPWLALSGESVTSESLIDNRHFLLLFSLFISVQQQKT